MTIQYIQATNKLNSKTKNGDACGIFNLDSQNIMVFIVADGVGGSVGDYKASKTVVDVFYESFKALDKDISIKTRIAKALENVNTTILNEEGYYSGMKSTVVLAVLDQKNNLLYYVGVGDSRIYKVTNENFQQITADQVKTIVRRKKDGTPITLKGVIINATGITNALGTRNFSYHIQELKINTTQSFLLATDGFYSKLNGDLTDIIEVAKAVDVKEPFKEVSKQVFQQQDDDATAIFFRVVLNETDNNLLQAIKIPEALVLAVENKNVEAINEYLYYIENEEVKLPFNYYDNLIKTFFKVKLEDSSIYQRLVSLLKKSSISKV